MMEFVQNSIQNRCVNITYVESIGYVYCSKVLMFHKKIRCIVRAYALA